MTLQYLSSVCPLMSQNYNVYSDMVTCYAFLSNGWVNMLYSDKAMFVIYFLSLSCRPHDLLISLVFSKRNDDTTYNRFCFLVLN